MRLVLDLTSGLSYMGPCSRFYAAPFRSRIIRFAAPNVWILINCKFQMHVKYGNCSVSPVYISVKVEMCFSEIHICIFLRENRLNKSESLKFVKVCGYDFPHLCNGPRKSPLFQAAFSRRWVWHGSLTLWRLKLVSFIPWTSYFYNTGHKTWHDIKRERNEAEQKRIRLHDMESNRVY
jgi:hypothetical protein